MHEKSLDAQWAPVLRATLTSARLNPRPASGAAAFSIEPNGNLRQTQAVTGSLAFTADGKFPAADPRGPVYLATRSLKPGDLSSLRRFAEARAREMPNVKELRVIGDEPLTAGGLDGLELTAVVNEANKESATFYYQAVLRDGSEGNYFLLVGIAPAETSQTYLPVFRKMTASFRRK